MNNTPPLMNTFTNLLSITEELQNKGLRVKVTHLPTKKPTKSQTWATVTKK